MRISDWSSDVCSSDLFALAQRVDWTKRYSMSNIGGFVMGKPDARTSLVEYISYTCSHCAEFTQKAAAPLKINWISTGAINVEIRNAVRDRYDLTADRKSTRLNSSH